MPCAVVVLFVVVRPRDGDIMSMQPLPWPAIPETTARAARAAAARGPYPLAMRIRDELGDVFADAAFAEAFGVGASRAGSGQRRQAR